MSGEQTIVLKKLTTHNIQKYNLSLEYFNLEILNTKSNVIAKTTLKSKEINIQVVVQGRKEGRKKKYFSF